MSTAERGTTLLGRLRQKLGGESDGERAERKAQEAIALVDAARSKALDAELEESRARWGVDAVDTPRSTPSPAPAVKPQPRLDRDGSNGLMRFVGLGKESFGNAVSRKRYELDVAEYESGALDERIERCELALSQSPSLKETQDRQCDLADARLTKTLVLAIKSRIKQRNFWMAAVAILALPASVIAGLASDPGFALFLVPAAVLWARMTVVSPAKVALPLALGLAAYEASGRLGGSGLYMSAWFAIAMSCGLIGFGLLSGLSKGFGDRVTCVVGRVRGSLTAPRRLQGRWNALTALIIMAGYVFPFAYEYAAPWNKIAAVVGIPLAADTPLPVARRSVTIEFRRKLAISESNRARLDLDTELAMRPSLVKFSGLDGGGWSSIYPRAFFALLGAPPSNYQSGPLWIDGPESGNPGHTVTQSTTDNYRPPLLSSVSKPKR